MGRKPKYTMKQIKAAESALSIDDPGAVNAAGISLALREAILAWFEAEERNTEPHKNPAAILIMNQLCHVMRFRTMDDLSAYSDAKARCREIASHRVIDGRTAGA